MADGAPRLPVGVLAAAWFALAVLTAAATITVLAAGASPGVPAWVDVGTAVAALALLPLLWSRRAVPATLTLAALAAVSGAATPAATAATLQVARWYPLRTAVPVAAAGAVGHAVQALWRPVGLPLGWWLLCDVAVHAALLGWGAWARERAAVLWSLRDRARRAEAEQARRVDEARTAERTRIAREMHDTLAHRLSLLAATAGALEYRPDGDPAQLAAAAGRVRAGVSDALEDLRQVIRLLRAAPGDLGPVPGLDDVARLVAEARSAGQDVTWAGPPAAGAEQVPGPVAVAVFRVVQEGLTNARRHAPGAAVRVTLTVGSADVRVRVVDDGGSPAPGGVEAPGGLAVRAGAPVAPGTGTGLVGLRERVTVLGGRLEAGTCARQEGGAGPVPVADDAGGGFVLEAWLPWDR